MLEVGGGGMRTGNAVRAIVACGATGLAVLLLLPPRARGYALLGGALRLPQRDLRVFDNFDDPGANDNQAEDPSFPGATGAELAIWKAAAEWGSEPHGDGLGDPTQGAIGSGGANFDFVWQGRASAVGGPDDNVVSQISGGQGGVLAFTETPISDGWRIRFYADAALWQDGPGDIVPGGGNRDLQGVAAHELGHALGLGHSGDLEATMISFLAASGVHFRSVENDDRAGIQALYGALSPDKPHVSGYEVSGSALTLFGSGFAASGNEVWFTRRPALADGTPARVSGLSSLDQGTRIQVVVPHDAARGDVLVKKPGQGNAALSNAFPFDPDLPPCPGPAPYGSPKTTSQGTVPALYASGRATLRTDDLVIGTSGGVPDAFGSLLSSSGRAAAPFAGGTLWIAPPLRREARFQFDFFGGVDLPVPVLPALVGSTRYYQIVFTDAGDPTGIGLSDGLEVRFCP